MSRDAIKLRETVEKFAKEAGITEEEFKALEADAAKEMDERGIPDENKEYYTLKRVQLSLKMKFSSAAQEPEGFLIAKEAPFDFVKKGREEINELIREEGQKIAKKIGLCDSDLKPIGFVLDTATNTPTVNYSMEQVDSGEMKQMPPLSGRELADQIIAYGKQEAMRLGRMNADGEFIYDKPDFKKGKVMPEHDWGCKAYGFFKMPGDTEPKLSYVTLRGDLATTDFPLFEVMRFQGRLNKNKSTASLYEITMLKPPTMVGESIDFWDLEDDIKKALGDQKLDNLREIESFIAKHPEYGRWCVVVADVMQVGASSDDFDVVAVTITDETMNSLQADDNELTFWATKGIAKGIADMTTDAVLVISPYKKKDGSIGGNLIGYWIDPLLRPISAGLVDGDSVLQPWDIK